ncbi:MAG: hypothetical protein JNG90_04330 [Planctomycetaceae bacterium]|nr:hypothetical protein [Planctomycetaceae bacterium]
MALIELDGAVGVLVLVQLVGLAAAIAARFHQGRRLQNVCHGAFLLCLGLTGLMTLAALSIGPGHGTISGGMLAVSVLTAVWEIRHPGTVTVR